MSDETGKTHRHEWSKPVFVNEPPEGETSATYWQCVDPDCPTEVFSDTRPAEND